MIRAPFFMGVPVVFERRSTRVAYRFFCKIVNKVPNKESCIQASRDHQSIV